MNLKLYKLEFTKAKEYILDKLQRELPEDLEYHNLAHVNDVYEAVLRYIKVLNITGEDALMLQTAALYHDAGFIVQAKGHEEISCRYARESLSVFGYTGLQVETICGMIMATRIPQAPLTKLEEIIADADLDYLGRDDFYPISDRLFHEMKATGVVSDEEQWNRLQVDFFEKHHYFTDVAKEWRNEKKAQHLLMIKAKINK